MSTRRRVALGFLLAIAAGFLLILLSHEAILRAAGNYLVESGPPEKADVAIVLAGDLRGARILRAASLVKRGYVRTALVSGPMEMYGLNEANLAIQYAIKRGAPAESFEPVYIRAMSTKEEAHGFAPELRKRGIRSVLLVTSNYHTRRAGETFRNILGPEFQVRTISAPDTFFRPDTWWHNREGQKTLFFEYSKTIASWLGL